MLFKRISVPDNTRALVTRKGRFIAILAPGDYTFVTGPMGKVCAEMYSLRALSFDSNWADFLVKERPAVVERNFVVVETRDSEVAIVSVDGKFNTVIAPGKRALYWRDAAAITAEIIDVNASPEVPKAKLAAIERIGRNAQVTVAVVEEGRTGLLYLDNRYVRSLDPGRYGFWTAASPRVDSVDVRRQTIEIPGQEILTKDKVSVRVNIVAEYQVVDAVVAKSAVKDFAERLYRALQLSVRQTLGRKTLEEILADKTDVDETVASAVRAEMDEIGVRVGVIALKDIILPGDMREILNQVVAAEKQAQANVIRRREETAATRSLLNTAKLMEDNPILVRLKELETLEKLVEKVDRVSVAGGFEGMLGNLLSMKDGT
jgi:regulator of protease activity HflC (stomatin/prohibitin superfamily)